MSATQYPVLYYDSPHRFLKNLQLLRELSAGSVDLIIGRELTKIFEQIKRGSIDEVIEYYEANPDKLKGEFVVIARVK